MGAHRGSPLRARLHQLLRSNKRTGAGRKPALAHGLWFQHRHRFARAVDRYYETAQAIHAGITNRTLQPTDAQKFEIVRLSAITTVFNELDARVDTLTQQAHAHAPVPELTVTAQTRAQVGNMPELLARAAGIVAQATQVAALARAQLQQGMPIAGQVSAATTYAHLAEVLVGQAESEAATIGAQANQNRQPAQ